MSIKVQRYLRNKILGDPTSPMLHYLKCEPGSYRTRTLNHIAADIELIGSMSREDIVHVSSAISRQIKKVLTDGDRVKIDGLGTFYLTFNSTGTEEEKDCTVRNIHKVNIRFKADNTLRLVNDSTATTRNAENNVKFSIKGDATGSSTEGGGNSGDGGDNGWVDPSA